MKKLFKYLFLVILLLTTVACGEYEIFTSTDKIEVAAVYWHERNKFSVAIINGDQLIMKRLPFRVTIFMDAKNPWYMCNGKRRNWDGIVSGSYCELHLSSIDDINGADWNHGKFGRGATKRIN